jgi:hypothetical protein
MKVTNIISIFIICIILVACNKKKKHEFIINEFINQNGSNLLNKNDFRANKSNIYEDSVYVVSKICNGEWGGTISFKNKITGNKFITSSTCPVIVNKLNNKYYITNSLIHMNGITNFIEIKDPGLLDSFEINKEFTASEKGQRILLDTVGIVTLATFIYEKEFYHIINNNKTTLLANINNKKFNIIDTISKDFLFAAEPEQIRLNDNHFVIFISGIERNGYIEIKNNNIKVKWRMPNKK